MSKPESREKLIQKLRELLPKSGEYWKSAQGVIPRGLLSGARQFEPWPFFTVRGKGAYIWDVDGNKFLDCCMGYGPLLLGHAPDVLEGAIVEQLQKGTVYGTPHKQEVEYAEKIIECVPCADGVMVCSTGTEATMQGIRIMRAYSGKDMIAKIEGGYHGWHDYAMWNVNMDPERSGPVERPEAYPETAGIPSRVRDDMLILPYDETAFDLIEEHANELAGVMIEPVLGVFMIPGNTEFLQKLRDLTQRLGIPLLFDEVITGFRLGIGGGQEYYGVTPDIATYGKICGGGLPVAAVGCSNEMLKAVTSEVSVSIAGTFSGNPLGLAAGNAILGYLMENKHIYDELSEKGDRLRNGFNDWAQSNGYPVTMTGTASMFQVHMRKPPITNPRDLMDQHMGALQDLQYFLRLEGIFIPWLHLAFISAAHSDADIDKVLEAHKVSAKAALELHGVV